MTSFSEGVWMSSPISRCTEVCFSKKKTTPFHLKRFATEDEAHHILNVLKENGHPNFAQVSPVFQVEGEYFLAFEKLGVSLEDFLIVPGNKRQFSNRHLITPFYQKIIIDLVRVWRHLVTLKVKCNLKLANVYVAVGDVPHVSLVDFDTGTVSCNGWNELAELIKNININCQYSPGGNEEMQIFLHGITSEYKDVKERLSTSPLLYSLQQRRSLTCDVWDRVKYSNLPLYTGSQIFTQKPTEWKSGYSKDKNLKKFMVRVESSNQNVSQTRNALPLVSTPNEVSTRVCLRRIRKLFVYFDNTRSGLGYHFQQAVRKVEDLQLLVEIAYPCYIPAIWRKAVAFQKSDLVTLLPENGEMKNLFIER